MMVKKTNTNLDLDNLVVTDLMNIYELINF